MRFIHGEPPFEVLDSHVEVDNTVARLCEEQGVPVRCYVGAFGGAPRKLVPKWAPALLRDWLDLPSPGWQSETLREVVRAIVRTGREDLAEAALSLARLRGYDAVDAWLRELAAGRGYERLG